jgi:hypothetical protein
VSFAAITLCIAFELVIPKVSIHFVIDSVRKLLDTPSYPWPLFSFAAGIGQHSDKATGLTTGIRFPTGTGLFLFATASRLASELT